MFKGQGQTTLLSPVCCPLIYFNPFVTCFVLVLLLQRRLPEFCTMGGIDVSETFLVSLSQR